MRLTKDVIPINYFICLETNLENSSFHGDVSINIEVKKDTNDIKFNAADLSINSVILKTPEEMKPVDIITEQDISILKFTSPILRGKHQLNISYDGIITHSLKGLYRTKCFDNDGKEQLAAVTQMVPIDARRCFPCWDEPNFKATFDITLIVPENQLALSNMTVKKTDIVTAGKIRYVFEKSPIMSTYLVAIVIGQYDYVEDLASGAAIRVYTPKKKSEQGRFALEVTTKVLPFYKDYFNISYPLSKLDLIGVADLSYGAMENWGLITYRENRVLVDPQNTSTTNKQEIALTVAHEVAHQWFGNLVTMDWWTDLWLNEGYATYLQYLSVDHLFANYKIWTQFVHDVHCVALKLDGLKNSHPIEVPIVNPGDVFEIFDAISYNKGASIIRMLVDYIGDDMFRKGMHIYLKRYEYKNACTEDLWNALEEASKEPIGELMATWTKQMGFPLIKVSRKILGDQKGVILTISQSKFNADGSSSNEYHWVVPISISTAANPSTKLVNCVLRSSSMEIPLHDIEPSQWVKVNVGTVGFFRTHYTDDMLEQFMHDIENKRIPAVDRLGLLDDLFALAKAGSTKTIHLLTFLKAFINETDYNVWSSIVTILDSLGKILEYTPYGKEFIQYQRNLLKNIKNRVNWNLKTDDHLEGLLQTLILNHLTSLDDREVMQEALKGFEKHISKEELLPADLRVICYKAAIRAQGKQAYLKLLNLYKLADLAEEQSRIIKSLASTSDRNLLDDVLKFFLSDEVRLADKIFGIISISQSKIGREIVWKYMKDNWSTISSLLNSASSLLPRLIKGSLENFVSSNTAEDIRNFFDKKEYGIGRSLQQVLESIYLNEAWLKRDFQDIGVCLKA